MLPELPPMRRVACLLVLAVVAAACSSKPSPNQAPTGKEGRAFAVWPEDTPEEAALAAERLEADEDPWRADPAATAGEFARRVLGWRDPGVEAVGAGGDARTFLMSLPGAADTVVVVGQLVAGRWWSVVSARGPEGIEPTLSVRDQRLDLSFPLGGAAYADVSVGYGDRSKALPGSDGDVSLDLGFRPTTPGHLVVLLKDESNLTVGVIASALPAGDVAAG